MSILFSRFFENNSKNHAFKVIVAEYFFVNNILVISRYDYHYHVFLAEEDDKFKQPRKRFLEMINGL